ncbi:MAG: PEP/pyruvate-binding domain-containing protein [Spirochaetaceae bacterium]
MADRYFFKETPFKQLMANRVGEILLVCSEYDKFMLEEDGRIDELLFQEYVTLNLRYPPKFTQVSSAHDAFEMLEKRSFDLIITMLNIGDLNAINLAQKIKQSYPAKPIIVLTPISTRQTLIKLHNTDLSSIDYIFSWQGNPNILLAMVKLIEDRMNVAYDANTVGVQTIILVEDSVRYYSSYLPMIYRTLFQQARCLMTEGLNEWQQTMRMRGRPKILLARTYEEALHLYETYKKNLLGIITDVAYGKGGKIDKRAGLKLSEHIRREDGELPILLQSSREEHKNDAENYKASFIHKNSKALLKELGEYIRLNYGFGEFVFRDPKTLSPIMSAHDLWDLQHRLMEVPDDSFEFHVKNNDFSKWLKARALFTLAVYLRPVQLSDFEDIKESKRFIIDAIKEFRIQEGRGTIAEFQRDRFDEISFFSRIGSGSLGGKGRGLAFIDLQLKLKRLSYKFSGVVISIPRTVVLTTQIFDNFMELNNLYETALSDADDTKMKKAFLDAALPERINDDISAILKVVTNPIAVRSSSLLEDSHYQPFAGIYDTYMLPNNHEDFQHRFQDLSNAIKMVYASTYFKNSKDYMKATGNMVEEEKMGVIIQEVTGTNYGDMCYPNIAGVARSLNFYPIENEKQEDGIVNIAFGLGKTVVDGETSLRFSPKYPKKIMQLADTDSAIKTTQKSFYAIDMNPDSFHPEQTDGRCVRRFDVKEAEPHGSLKYTASTYDFQNHVLRDGVSYQGKRVLTFASILKYNMFPLADIIQTLLEMGRQAMNTPIEIEFAVNLDTPKERLNVFSFLQIRPIVEGAEQEEIEIEEHPPESTIIYSNKAMGNGIYDELHDLVYVKPEAFDPAHTKEMAQKIGELNEAFAQKERGYILTVPGRLGSSDSWLGIPTSWAQISNARVIVEMGLSNFRVDPSQGTHFFQNLTSLQNAYLTINPFVNDGIFNEEYLKQMEPEFEDSFFRHVRFENPLTVKIDGKTGRGIIFPGVAGKKPEESKTTSEVVEEITHREEDSLPPSNPQLPL